MRTLSFLAFASVAYPQARPAVMPELIKEQLSASDPGLNLTSAGGQERSTALTVLDKILAFNASASETARS